MIEIHKTAYDPIVTTKEYLGSYPGRHLVAILEVEETKQEWDPDTRQHVFQKIKVPQFVLAFDSEDSALTELARTNEDLRRRVSTLDASNVKLDSDIQKMEKELADLRGKLEASEKAVKRSRADLSAQLEKSRKLEEDLGSVRKHFGAKAFQEAIGVRG